MPATVVIAGITFNLYLPDAYQGTILSFMPLFMLEPEAGCCADFVVEIDREVSAVHDVDIKERVHFVGCGQGRFSLYNTQFSLDVILSDNRAAMRIATDGAHVPAVIFSAFKWFVVYMSISTGALPLHSSLVEFGGDGLVFCGQSGKGKSTIHSLLTQSEGFSGGSDEVNIVLIENDQMRVYPTPFSSSSSQSIFANSLLLRKIFFLEQSPGFSISGISRSAAAGFLLKTLFYYPADAFVSDVLMDSVVKYSLLDYYAVLYFKNNSYIGEFLKTEVLLTYANVG